MIRGSLLGGLLAASVTLTPAWAHPFDPFAEDKQGALTLVLEHMREGETQEALLQADDAISKFPKHGPFYTLKAQILLTTRQVTEALPIVNRGIELAPDYALSYWVRGLIRLHQKDTLGAIADFDRVLELEDQNQNLMAQAIGNRGMAKVELGRHTEGLVDLDRALEVRPTTFAERQFRAIAYLALDRLDAAQSDIEALLSRDPTHSLTHRLHGELLLKRNKPDRALTALDQAAKLNPKDGFVYKFRAEAHQKLKHPNQSNADLAKACKWGIKSACSKNSGATP